MNQINNISENQSKNFGLLNEFFAVFFGVLAISLAPITWVAPVARARLLFGFFLSYFYLGEKERWKDKLIGGMLILASAMAIVLAGR